ncbi:MAG: hypothetical protein ACE5FI_16500, partial [Anaerolineales bacterium]
MSTGTTPKISEHSNTVLGWLTLLALGALVLAFIHAELYTVYGPFLKIRDWSPIPTWAVWVRRVRWPVRFGALASLLTLLYFELRWNHVTRSFERFTAHRMGLIVVLAAMGALSGMYYLLPGYLQAAAANGDYYMHMAWLVLDTLRAGQLPIWTNWGDMGFPLMQFYSPLLFVSLAVTNVVIPNIWIATKWFFFGLHIASVFAMFAYANRLTRSRFAALTAALAYGIAFYRYHTIVYLNKFVMGPTFVLWPLQLYFVERIITGKSNLRSGVGLALATAAGLVSHIYFGFFAALFTFAYAAIRLWSVRPSRAEMWNTGKRLVIWFAAGVMASLF